MRKRKEKTEKTGGGQKRIGKRKATEREKKIMVIGRGR